MTLSCSFVSNPSLPEILLYMWSNVINDFLNNLSLLESSKMSEMIILLYLWQFVALKGYCYIKTIYISAKWIMIHQVKRSLIMLETVWSMKVIYHFILQYNTIFVSLRSLHFLLRYYSFFENKPNLMFFSNNTIYYHLQLTILSFFFQHDTEKSIN